MRTITLSLILVLIIVAPTITSAQPDSDIAPRKYVAFEIDPSFQSLLKNRLQADKQLTSLKKLVKQISDDPLKFKLDPQTMKDLNLDDPQMKRLVKDWADRDPEMKQALKDWVDQNRQNGIEKRSESKGDLQKTIQSILDQPEPKVAPPATVKSPPPRPKTVELPKPKEDKLAKLTEQAMKNTEQTKLGDWLRASPAWRDALVDLQASIDTPKGTAWDFSDWNQKLGLPNDKAWELGEGWIDRLSKLTPPKMDGWKFDFRIPEAGGLPAPTFNGPALPDVPVPSLPAMSMSLTWLLFMILFAVVGWRMVRWSKHASAAKNPRARLGPWPIRPEAVTTRTELVLAFNYLALLTLGPNAESWNHQAVAKSWREKAPGCDPVAITLAQLYEQARYTNGVETLTDAQRAEARRSLLKLAETF